MTRFATLASALTLAALLGACASENGDAPATTAEAPQVTQVAVADTEAMQPLPQAVATEGPVDALQMPVSYACSQGRTFTAVFPGHGRSVTVSAAGETRVLEHKGATDAVMFADASGVTMTAEGADATLTGLDGAYTGCLAG